MIIGTVFVFLFFFFCPDLGLKIFTILQKDDRDGNSNVENKKLCFVSCIFMPFDILSYKSATSRHCVRK